MILCSHLYQYGLCPNGKPMSNPIEDLRKIESILANLDDDLKDNQDIHQLSCL